MAQTVAAVGRRKIAIVKRCDLHRFVVLPKRWIVERTFAWIGRNRRRARDLERDAATVAAFLRLASIRRMRKRLTRPMILIPFFLDRPLGTLCYLCLQAGHN